MIPTRWRVRLEDQLRDARDRLARATTHLGDDDGSRSVQAAYQAAVSAATVRVWLRAQVWETPFDGAELPGRVQDHLPNLFSALAALDLQHALTSPWTVDAARPYVVEAESFVADIGTELEACLSAD